VGLGCIGEFVAEFTSLPKSEERRHKISKLSLIILILGIAGELLSAARTSQLSGQIIANIEERAANADQKAGEANDRAAKNEKEAAQLRMDAEEMKQALAPRRLTIKQRAAISSQLSSFSRQPVVAISNPFDAEASILAAEILSTLKSAKWDTTVPHWSIGRSVSSLERAPSIPVTGILIQAAPDKRSQLAAKALVRELLSNGFDSRIPEKGVVGFGPKSDPLIVVDVEARPEGPQGDAKVRADAKKVKSDSNQTAGPMSLWMPNGTTTRSPKAGLR